MISKVSGRFLQGPVFYCLLFLVQSVQSENLLDIYELALENDAQLKIQEARYLSDIETENMALSMLLPQANAHYGVSGDTTETISQQILGLGVTGRPVIGEGSNKNNLQVKRWGASLSQTLFDLSAWYNLQASEEFSKQAEAEFAAATQNLIIRVTEVYFGVLRAQESLAVAKAQEQELDHQLEQAQQRFEVGITAITDVHEAKAASDFAKVQRIIEENNVDIAWEQLSVLTGQTHGSLFRLNPDFEVKLPAPVDRSAWVNFALENNYQLAASRYAEESARQRAKSGKMEHAPTLTASYQYSETDTDGTQEGNPEPIFLVQPNSQRKQQVWQVRLDVPIFQGGRTHAQRRQAAQQYIAAKESRIKLERTTVTNARSLHMTTMSDVARIKAHRQSIKSSQIALDAAEAGYEVGTRNIADVLNSRKLLYTSQRDYTNSRYDFILNVLRLKENAGVLSPNDLIDLNNELIALQAAIVSDSMAIER